MITAPAGADNTHLQALAKLSSLLINPDLVEKLKAAKTADEVIDLFSQAEADKDKEDAEREAELAAKKEAEAKAASDEKPLIVGVTACINGIAHTYMAEEALIKAGEKRGVEVRIETNGSEGVKHELTADEIKRAKGVIIASDKQVKMARFDGKKLVKHPVVDGINKPDQLIDEILSGKGSVYHAEAGEASESSAASDGSVWSTIYRHLMSGISHMLPFVIGGGILMAISFLVEQYMGGAKSPAFIFLNSAGNLAFAFMVPVLAGYIAESIGDLPALMPGFVGGFMASIANSSLGGSYAVNADVKAASPAGFLGGIAIGFIAGYLILGLKKLFTKLPKNVEGMKPIVALPNLWSALRSLDHVLHHQPGLRCLERGYHQLLERHGHWQPGSLDHDPGRHDEYRHGWSFQQGRLRLRFRCLRQRPDFQDLSYLDGCRYGWWYGSTIRDCYRNYFLQEQVYRR